MPNRVRRLTVLAVLTLPVMLAGCEMLRLTPEPAPQPVQETPPPAAPVGEPQAERAIPLPARKPSPPVVASAPSPAAAMPAEEHLPRPPVVVGLTRDALIEQFGRPAGEREAAPARVMEFTSGDCRLAAYLYFDTTRNDFYTLQYEVNGLPAPHDAVDRCLSRIARDASRR